MLVKISVQVWRYQRGKWQKGKGREGYLTPTHALPCFTASMAYST